MSVVLSAGKGVTLVVERCEAAKEGGFLDLSSCQLMYIPDAIYMLIKGYEVTRVSFQDNLLKKFPKKMVAKFPTATILNLSGNEISELPLELADWKSLKGVNAANNKIEGKFPEPLFSLENLIFLDLSGNLIDEIDVSRLYQSLPKLKKLNLSENPKIAEDLRQKLASQKPHHLELVI